MSLKPQKKLLDISIFPNAKDWRYPGKNDSDPEFVAAKDATMKRDTFQCRFCDFRTALDTKIKNNGLEIHALDGDGMNLSPSNLVTACNFCRMPHNLEYASEQGAILVFIPELSQVQLNNIVRSIFYTRYCVEIQKNQKKERELVTSTGKPPSANAKALMDAVSGGQAQAEKEEISSTLRPILPLASSCEAVFAELKARAAYAEELIGTSAPHELAKAMLQIENEETYTASAARIKDEIKQKWEMSTPDVVNPRDIDSAMRPSIDEVLYGIRVLPTSAGCDPKAWHPPTGSYITTPVKQWEEHFLSNKKNLIEAGIEVDF